jgi:hypothetical protein
MTKMEQVDDLVSEGDSDSEDEDEDEDDCSTICLSALGKRRLGKPFYTEDDDRSVLFGGPWMVADQHTSCSRIKAKF